MSSVNVPSTLAGPGVGCCGKSITLCPSTTLKSALGWMSTNPHGQQWSSSAPLLQSPAWSIMCRGQHREAFGNSKPVSGFGINLGQSVMDRTCRYSPQLITGLSLDPELSLPGTSRLVVFENSLNSILQPSFAFISLLGC